MNWYVYYCTDRYIGYELKVLPSELHVVEFLNKHAGNPNFDFNVIEGREVKFKAAETVTKYVRDR